MPTPEKEKVTMHRKKTPPKIDPFVVHEAVDRAHLASDWFDGHVLAHSYVRRDPRLKAAAGRLSDALGDFYQRVARTAFEAGDLTARGRNGNRRRRQPPRPPGARHTASDGPKAS